VVGFVGNNALSSANTAAASQNWAKAESEARKAISWAPWSDDPWRVLGEAQVGAHDFAAAKASFAHAARVNPRNWLNWYDLGTVTRGVAQRRAYGQAALLNPLDPGIAVLRQLGVLPRSA
jgi:Flp pilus assembly protein TadD